MLTEKEINDNYERFIGLIKSVDREGIDELIKYIDSTDFKYAPASTRYHGSFDGGLCAHSLKVYDLLVAKIKLTDLSVSDDTLKICALLHDISKVNTYEKTFTNKKIYSSDGSKHDAGGNFEWVPVETYKRRDLEDRFVYGTHEEDSEFIVRQFLPLSIEESTAICHHHAGMGAGSIDICAVSDIYNKYPFCVLLHTSDLEAAYLFY